MTATTAERPAEQDAPKPAAPKPASKPAAKPAPGKPAPAKAPAKPAAAKPTAPQTADSPLTPEQKRELGNLVIATGAKLLASNPAALKGLPANTVKAQVAAWLAYVPHTEWPASLPARRK
jgi:hypothetical protein